MGRVFLYSEVLDMRVFKGIMVHVYGTIPSVI
jgi:hypothetical protein